MDIVFDPAETCIPVYLKPTIMVKSSVHLARAFHHFDYGVHSRTRINCPSTDVPTAFYLADFKANV